MTRSAFVAAAAAAALALAVSGCAASAPTRALTPAPGTVVSAAPRTPAASRSSGTPGPSESAPAVAPAAAHPVPTPCTGNRRARFVYVSIRRQHLWMCARQRVAYSTPITSGVVGEYTSTPTGTFEIQGRQRGATLTLNTGQQYHVQYWIPFQGPLFGFHDAPWQTFPFGSQKYRTDGSHGCVHLPLKAIAFLYRWGTTGTPVTIHA